MSFSPRQSWMARRAGSPERLDRDGHYMCDCSHEERTMITALLIIFGSAASAIVCSWGYFRRYTIARPPIGVVNGWDVAMMIGAIVLVPYLYLALPRWLVASMLA